jgi:long-chain acyl-CoA synthetase
MSTTTTKETHMAVPQVQAMPTHSKVTQQGASGQDPYAGFVAPPRVLLETAKRLDQAPAYAVKTKDGWQSTSWKHYGTQVHNTAKALMALQVERGDAVAILSFNCPQWTVAGFGTMAAGGMPAGIYWTSSNEDILYILNHCKARVLFVENEARLKAAQPILEQATHLRHIVLFDGQGAPTCGKDVLNWEAFCALSNRVDTAAFERRLASITPQDIGTLIYTSGTTGPAKAVCLTQGNLWWSSRSMLSAFDAGPQDRMISYLPLAHIAEQIGSMHNQAHAGFQVFFARSMEELGDHLKEVHPTVFLGVPRVWEKMQSAIETKLQGASGMKAKLARWALRVGRDWHEKDLAGQPTGPWLTLQKSLANRLIHRKVKEALGFDQARLLLSAAAPIAPESLRFFLGLDVVVREGYGQSEACGPSTLSLPGTTKIGSVGLPLAGTEFKVAEDGELLVRGPHIFQGYMGQPGATADALHGEWLQTGDLGRIDAEGYVYITGRKKDLIITSGGKNISPANIEAALMDTHLIEHAVVCGDGRHFLTALISLDQAAVSAHAVAHGLTGDPMRHPEIMKRLQADIDRVNERQARVAHIRKYALLPAPLSIEGGELTPTLKVKRKVVIERNAALIDDLYRNTN